MAADADAAVGTRTHRYLNHPDRHKVNFTLLLQPGYWFHGQESGSNETWVEELARYTSYFQMDGYQMVTIGTGPPRPLVFSFGRAINRTHLQDFRAATKDAIGVYPYFVSMNGQVLPEIDAQSHYGGGSGSLAGTCVHTRTRIHTWACMYTFMECTCVYRRAYVRTYVSTPRRMCV